VRLDDPRTAISSWVAADRRSAVRTERRLAHAVTAVKAFEPEFTQKRLFLPKTAILVSHH
jgi:hypothetical protein